MHGYRHNNESMDVTPMKTFKQDAEICSPIA